MAQAPEKIDVHSHFLPSAYREQLKAHGHGAPDGYPILPVSSPCHHGREESNLLIATCRNGISSLTYAWPTS